MEGKQLSHSHLISQDSSFLRSSSFQRPSVRPTIGIEEFIVSDRRINHQTLTELMGDHHIHRPKPRRPPSFLQSSVPTFEEAAAATFDVSAALNKLFNPTPEELNAALEKRFLPSKKTSSAVYGGASSSSSTVPESALRNIDNTERPVTDVSSSNPHPVAASLQESDDTCLFPSLKDCLDDDDDAETPVTVSPSEPNPVLQAFSLLRNDPGIQNVVASLISDQNLWEAVKNNKKVMEYMESFKDPEANNNDVNQSANATATASGGEIIPTDGSNANQSTTATGGEIIPTDDNSASGPISLMQAMNLRVLAIVRSLLGGLYQKIFGKPAAEEGRGSAAEESSSEKSIWKDTSITAPIMVLTIAVIMVVMVKRE